MDEVITREEISAYAHRFGYTLVRVSAEDNAVLRALEKLWSKIREHDSRVPVALFDLTPGRSSGCVSVGWDQLSPVIEINLRPEGQNSTGAEVLEFLLHQAAHSIAGPVKSSEGRWHNRAYRDAAESIGLDTAVDATGYGATSLASGTRTRYRNELSALDRALAKWEPTEQVKAERSSRNGVVLQCSCDPPRKIRIRGNPDHLDVTGIRCEHCGQPFTASASG